MNWTTPFLSTYLDGELVDVTQANIPMFRTKFMEEIQDTIADIDELTMTEEDKTSFKKYILELRDIFNEVDKRITTLHDPTDVSSHLRLVSCLVAMSSFYRRFFGNVVNENEDVSDPLEALSDLLAEVYCLLSSEILTSFDYKLGINIVKARGFIDFKLLTYIR
jgi:hypothetical protein